MHLSVCTLAPSLCPHPRVLVSTGIALSFSIPGRPPAALLLEAGAPGASPPGLRWAGLGGDRRTSHSPLHPWSWNSRQRSPASGMERSPGGAGSGALLCQPGGSLHLYVFSRLSSWRVSDLWSLVPARKPVRAGVGGVGGLSSGWDVGRPQLVTHPLADCRWPGNSGWLRQAGVEVGEGLTRANALPSGQSRSYTQGSLDTESVPRSPRGSPSRNLGGSRARRGLWSLDL